MILTKNGQVSKDYYRFVVGQTQLECVNQYIVSGGKCFIKW